MALNTDSSIIGGGGDLTFVKPSEVYQAYAFLIEPKKHFTYTSKYTEVGQEDEAVVTTTTIWQTSDDLETGNFQEIEDAAWANGKALVGSLKRLLEESPGDGIAVRLTKGKNSPKGNPPWLFVPVAPADAEKVGAYLEERDAGLAEDAPSF